MSGERKNSAKAGPKAEAYARAGRREKNKARRIERDKRRAKPMSCGHGSRHRHPDGGCRRCFAERTGGQKR